MMKLKKILFILLIMFSFVFIKSVKVEAAPRPYLNIPASVHPDDILKGYTYLRVDEEAFEPTLNFARKINPINNKYSAYCINQTKGWYYDGSVRTFNYNGELSREIAYVLANGYPNESITGDEKEDYYITGIAIYYLLNEPCKAAFNLNFANPENSTFAGVTSPTAAEVAKLVRTAIEQSSSYVAPRIILNSSNVHFTLSGDKKYYVSNEINVGASDRINDYTVRLGINPSINAIVTDTNGNAKNSFSYGEKFLIKILAEDIKDFVTQFDVEITSSYDVKKAYVYAPSDNSLQSVVIEGEGTEEINGIFPLKLEIFTSVEISKIDAVTGKELPGAHLVIKDKNGNIVKEIDTTDKIAKFPLIPGEYILTEKTAPEGYQLNNEEIPFVVYADGSVVKKTLRNYPIGDVYISKIDATTEKEISGAKLVIKDSKGKKVDEWVSDGTPHKVKVKLEAGKYTLTETKAPKGYKLNEETIEFTVEADGTVKEPVIMRNYPDIIIKISKQDATTEKELPGATLIIKDSSGKQLYKWVSEEKPYEIKNLKPGKYTLTEISAPKGYKLNEETIEFTVEEDGTVKEPVIMYNEKEVEPVPTGDGLIYAAWIIGMAAIGYSIYYFRNLKKENV